MKTKTLPVVVLTAILVFFFAATSCWAHGKKRDNLEAVVIAAGAVVLVNALVNPGYYSPPAVCYTPTVVYIDRSRSPRHGHWRQYRRHHNKAWQHRAGHNHRPW